MTDQVVPNDIGVAAVAVLFGVCAGLVDVWISDLLLTALVVMAATMLLGVLRPVHPWRWVVLVAVFVPIAHMFAYLLWKSHPNRAQVYESFLGFLTGTVGAYAGAVMRKAIAAIFVAK